MPEAVIHNLSDARLRYPAPAFHPILITEVTRMLQDHFCVAGFDLQGRRMVRPLRRRGQHWVFDEWQPEFRPGHLVNAQSVIRSRYGVLPHAREDIIAHDGVDILEHWTDAELLAAMLPEAVPSIVALLGCEPLEHRYLPEGADCPSLGGIRAVRSALKFVPAAENRVRLAYRDYDRRVYTLPVTCNRLRTWLDGDGRGAERGNAWLHEHLEDAPLVLRLGLTRGYAGSNGEFDPKRCFLQVNGILTGRPLPGA